MTIGSSPLARGLPRNLTMLPIEARIIPARAGFTSVPGAHHHPHQDHPRSRGVYPLHPLGGGDPPGSSPLARGLRIWGRASTGSSMDHPRSRGVYATSDQRYPQLGGSSPLARGLPPRGYGPARAREDHPRSRGVYFCLRTAVGHRTGSSPLARGLQVGVRVIHFGAWIIPARAGFTAARSSPPPPRWDHPRSRGVYRSSQISPVRMSGSSPLARGLRVVSAIFLRMARIIPARAGFTRMTTSPSSVTWDHPRSRGVYPAVTGRGVGDRGSSPLARGLPQGCPRAREHPRIIPARAGFTRDEGPEYGSVGDHPRSRGVYVEVDSHLPEGRGIIPARAGFTRAARSRRSVQGGSSPLARGLRVGGDGGAGRKWIIPARAGFTQGRSG